MKMSQFTHYLIIYIKKIGAIIVANTLLERKWSNIPGYKLLVFI